MPVAAPITRWLREGHTLLFWAPQNACYSQPDVVYYTTDDKPEFAYDPLNRGRDFGPLDLTATVIYCRWVDSLVNSHDRPTALVHMAADNIESWSNTVTLCAAYLVLAKGYSAAAAFQPFEDVTLLPFLDCRGDAADIFEDIKEQDFQLHVIDVLRGLQHARDLGWLDYRSFPVDVHRQMLRPEHGDMTWLLEGKAIAMASPFSQPHDADNHRVCTPEDMVHFFHHNKVGIVIQCNCPRAEETGEREELLSYDPQRFQQRGIRHVWLPFEDGGCPTVDIIQRFLSACESQAAAFAVHCRSGLGRTATLIGAYAIRHCGFTARSFIGWSRVCRPGTVHGSQQQYLVNLEPYLQMGAPKALSTLTSIEQLKLLPTRELRFFALDLNISEKETQNKIDEEVIQMILEAREQRSAAHVSQTMRPVDPALNRVAPPMIKTEGLEIDWPIADPWNSPSSPSMKRKPKKPMVTSPVISPSSPMTRKPKKPMATIPGIKDFWGELGRYLHLLTRGSTPAIGGWKEVAQLVEQLEAQTKAENSGQVKRFQSKSSQGSQDPAELERLKLQQQEMVETSKAKEEELHKVLQQLHAVQRECSQLRLSIAKGHGEVEVEAAAKAASAEGQERLREMKAYSQQLREERELQQQYLQDAKQRLNEPWESAKTSLDRLRSRMQVVP